MFKHIDDHAWIFDAEWVPDPATGRRVLALPDAMPDAEVVGRMFERAGADEENPRPYLKTVLCRIVSISAIKRHAPRGGPVTLELRSLPEAHEPALDEATLIASFLHSLGRTRPQLVGFNVRGADLPILLQRGMAHGIAAPEFCRRPDKPWEDVDYFDHRGEAVVDLMEVLGPRGRGGPSLHELACAAGIPGKMETAGENVLDLWDAGEVRRIVEYNEYDAITTYLLWLRTAHLAGHLATPEYEAEQRQLERMLEDRAAAGAAHLARYLGYWRRWRAGLS